MIWCNFCFLVVVEDRRHVFSRSLFFYSCLFLGIFVENVQHTTMRIILFVLSCYLMAGCGQTGNHPTTQKTDSTGDPTVVKAANTIPPFRDTVQKEPVAEYRVKTDNPLNDWYFSVRLYETPKTFYYLIRLQFEEIQGTDTLKLPNFGISPRPEVRKGPENYSCIIGFMDKDNQFREYKKVYVVGERLKITALKHYAVYTYQDEKK
jgi:hypothetical protein